MKPEHTLFSFHLAAKAVAFADAVDCYNETLPRRQRVAEDAVEALFCELQSGGSLYDVLQKLIKEIKDATLLEEHPYTQEIRQTLTATEKTLALRAASSLHRQGSFAECSIAD